MCDPYLYPDSEVLKNLADIQDEQMQKDMEADYTLYRLSEIVTDANWMKFDFDSLCEMHYRIFQDIYEWAGRPRIMRDALVAANAVFHDLGDLRKPEYLRRIVQDALEQGQKMRECIVEQLHAVKLPVSEDNIRKIVFWNREDKKEHSAQEIKKYLESETDQSVVSTF